MAGPVTLYDGDGNVIDLGRLKKQDATPSLATMRNPAQEHPSWGMEPDQLGSLLRSSESVDPSRWFAFATDIEEREWHYRGVLGTRKGAVAQLPATVDPAMPDKESLKHADFIRSIVFGPEFQLSLIDVLDALGKGVSYIEIVWQVIDGQWIPGFQWADQRWFRFDRNDLTTPLLLDDRSIPQPLAAYKWIVHYPRLLSGLPIRGGLARAAAWAWMFKNFDIKAWSIFVQVFGHPLRLGHYPASAKYDEKATLLNAVASIGVDAAAIIPEGMKIEFIQAASGAGGGGAVFKDMADYLDQQMSKLVLGQTSTTDAIAGGHAVGKVQNHVREDIERFDAMQLSATLNRCFVRPAIDLNFGPQAKYPTLTIGRAETQDLTTLFTNLPALIDRGLPVDAGQVYELLGLEEPPPGATLLKPAPGGQPGPSSSSGDQSGLPDLDDGDEAGNDVAAARKVAAAALTPPPSDSIDQLSDELGGNMNLLKDMRQQIADAIEQSSSFEELTARIETLAKGPVSQRFVDQLALAMFNAALAGTLGAPIGPTGT